MEVLLFFRQLQSLMIQLLFLSDFILAELFHV